SRRRASRRPRAGRRPGRPGSTARRAGAWPARSAPHAARLRLSCGNPSRRERMGARTRIGFVATLAAVVSLGASGCGYNRIQGADEQVKAAWAEVGNQYQRRADLVQNLVNTVKGAADFERET